jgi:hypothetical protein
MGKSNLQLSLWIAIAVAPKVLVLLRCLIRKQRRKPLKGLTILNWMEGLLPSMRRGQSLRAISGQVADDLVVMAVGIAVVDMEAADVVVDTAAADVVVDAVVDMAEADIVEDPAQVVTANILSKSNFSWPEGDKHFPALFLPDRRLYSNYNVFFSQRR